MCCSYSHLWFLPRVPYWLWDYLYYTVFSKHCLIYWNSFSHLGLSCVSYQERMWSETKNIWIITDLSGRNQSQQDARPCASDWECRGVEEARVSSGGWSCRACTSNSGQASCNAKCSRPSSVRPVSASRCPASPFAQTHLVGPTIHTCKIYI